MIGPIIDLTTPQDALAVLRRWIRQVRQRAGLTQQELARKSGIPATTISRFERTGRIASDSLMYVLLALDQLEAVSDFLKERCRLAAFPCHLNDAPVRPDIKRVRHRKGSPCD